MKLKVKKLHESAILPTKNDGDACFDLYASEHVFLYNYRPCVVHTNIALEIPEGYAGFIWDRSGMGSRGIHRLAGVIDSSYRGEIQVVLMNLNNDREEHLIQIGDRIAQIFITKVEDFVIEVAQELSDTERGEKGFGSSGN